MTENALPPWAIVEISDLEVVDFERPLADSETASYLSLNNKYLVAREQAATHNSNTAHVEARVFAMLESICGMHFRADEPNEPFAAMITWADGKRSAIPEDFVGRKKVLCAFAEKASNCVLRARLSDLCWMLDSAGVIWR